MSFVDVADLSELDDGPLAVEVEHSTEGSVPVALVKIADDEVHAIYDECSHTVMQLSEGEVDKKNCTLECAAHGSRFDLRTGVPQNPPASRPVPVYPVRIEATRVLVDVENPKEN